MKSFLTTSLFFFISVFFLNAQPWNIEWQYMSDKQSLDYLADIDQMPDGSFVVLGCEEAGNSTSLQLFHVDGKGNTLWSQSLNAAGNNIPKKVKCMENGDFLVLGQTGDENSNKTLLLRTDLNGTEIWQSWLDTTQNLTGNDIVSLPDNGFLIAGSSGNQQKQMWVARFDEKGQLIWNKNYHTNLQGSIASAKLLPTGEFVLSARVQGTSKNDCDIMVIRTDNSGNEIWSNQIKSPQAQEWPECICCSPDSTFIVVGWAGNCLNDINSEYPVFDHDLLVKKLDQNGKVLWSRSIDSEGSEGGNSVVVRPDGHFIVAGAKLTSFSGKIGPWLLHLDTDGNTLDESMLNMRFDQASKIINTSDGGFAVVGPGLHDKLNTRSDGWIVKFSGM